MYRYLGKNEYGDYELTSVPTDGYDKVSEDPNGEPLAYAAYKNGLLIQWLDGATFIFGTLDDAMEAYKALGKPEFVPLYKVKD
jgi:hypothetical protein